MKVLITGSAGMLGLDVTDACVKRDYETFALPRAELAISDPMDVDEAFSDIRPDVAINCAAWTDVDGAEEGEAEATRVNGAGAGLVAKAAEAYGAKVIHISSDYVFDGRKRSPYVESDPPHAISGYGRSKQAGEAAVLAANPRHLIARSSWLYCARGPNFVETMLRVAGQQSEVVVVNDQVGSPTYTRHLADALVDLIDSEDYGIHHVAAAGRCSWFEFAQEIFDQADSECRVMSGTTEMLGRPAHRPAWSVLGSERDDAFVLPHWRDGLSDYLAERERLDS
ncbi:dTDP-4-dehydrorhamnose reductase [soil metagenome]